MEVMSAEEFANLKVDVDQNRFYRECLLELNDILENVIGAEEGGAFVGLVANRMAEFFISAYREVDGRRHYSANQLASLLVDLKQRIGGEFYIQDVSHKKIVLRNRRCPFGTGVVGNRALCNMTSGVFGKIVAESNNYAAISVDEAIASGDNQCQITILLRPEEQMDGLYKEYYSVR